MERPQSNNVIISINIAMSIFRVIERASSHEGQWKIIHPYKRHRALRIFEFPARDGYRRHHPINSYNGLL